MLHSAERRRYTDIGDCSVGLKPSRRAIALASRRVGSARRRARVCLHQVGADPDRNFGAGAEAAVLDVLPEAPVIKAEQKILIAVAAPGRDDADAAQPRARRADVERRSAAETTLGSAEELHVVVGAGGKLGAKGVEDAARRSRSCAGRKVQRFDRRGDEGREPEGLHRTGFRTFDHGGDRRVRGFLVAGRQPDRYLLGGHRGRRAYPVAQARDDEVRLDLRRVEAQPDGGEKVWPT